MSTKVMSKMSFIILKTFRDIFYHAKMSLYLILLYSESKRFLKSSKMFSNFMPRSQEPSCPKYFYN